MRIAMFSHSMNGWDQGGSHFVRGVACELQSRGHEVGVHEPAAPGDSGAGGTLDGVELAIVHDATEPALVARLGAARRRRPGMRLLFHATHDWAVSAPHDTERYDLRGYDGVLASCEALREAYLGRGWARRAWTWHRAADTRLFRPRAGGEAQEDLVWVGNWGAGERAGELREFLIDPVRELGLRATVYGAGYPASALDALRGAGARYGGRLPAARVPEVLRGARVTVHVAQRPSARVLPGAPAMRVFEALACGVPLVCSPWEDREGLFTPGRNYLTAENGAAMAELLRFLLDNPEQAGAQAERGLMTIKRRHTCAHRVDELMVICRELGLDASAGGGGTAAGPRGAGSYARAPAAAAGDPLP